jgi:hypothetical protein
MTNMSRLNHTALLASQPYALRVRIWPMNMPNKAQMRIATTKQSYKREVCEFLELASFTISQLEKKTYRVPVKLGKRLCVAETDCADVDDQLQTLEYVDDVLEPGAKDALSQITISPDGEYVAV